MASQNGAANVTRFERAKGVSHELLGVFFGKLEELCGSYMTDDALIAAGQAVLSIKDQIDKEIWRRYPLAEDLKKMIHEEVSED